jgi:hypothetical protein
MKKLISATLLSAVAMLAATTPTAQNTTPPATTTVKKAHKKHVKAKTAVKPAATATPAK